MQYKTIQFDAKRFSLVVSCPTASFLPYLLFSCFIPRPAYIWQSRGLGFAKALDLKQALGEELDEGGTYTQWPRLLRQVLAASVLVREFFGWGYGYYSAKSSLLASDHCTTISMIARGSIAFVSQIWLLFFFCPLLVNEKRRRKKVNSLLFKYIEQNKKRSVIFVVVVAKKREKEQHFGPADRNRSVVAMLSGCESELSTLYYTNINLFFV